VNDRRTHWLAALVFALTLFAYFQPALTGGRVFTNTAVQQGYVFPWAAAGTKYPFALQSDQADLSMPALQVQRRGYLAGELAYVDLYSYGGGNALYADYSTGQAYPPRMLVAAMFEPVDAHLAYTLVHLFAAGMFTYLLVRRYHTRWLTGVFAGLSWMLGSWTLAWMHLAPVLVISALLPAGLWAMHRAVELRSPGAIALCGGVMGATLIAGHALFGAVTTGITGVYGLGLSCRDVLAGRGAGSRGERVHLAAVVPQASAIAVLSWAFILLPLVAARGESARAPLTYAELQSGQLAPVGDLLGAMWPFALPLSLERFNTLSFVGILTGLLALVGALSRRSGSGLGRTMALVMGAAMIGGPVTWLLFHLVPPMDLFRPYARLALYLGFAVVILGATGLECALDKAGDQLRQTHRERWQVGLFAIAGILIGLNSLHLMHYGRLINPEFPPDDASSVFPDTPFIRALRTAADSSGNGWPGRAVPLSPVRVPGEPWSPPILFGAMASWVGVESASGLNSTMTERTQRHLRVLTGEELAAVVSRDRLGSYVPEFWWSAARYDLFGRNGYNLIITPPSLNPGSAWGQQHVASGELVVVYEGPDGNIYRIVGAAPGAHGVSRVAAVADDTTALELFTVAGFDAGSTVLMAPDDAAAAPTARDGTLPVAAIADARRTTNGYRFTASAAAETLVVVPVNWSAGWSASIDGREAAVRRGNYNQLVIRVPAGASRVSLDFRPPGLTAGVMITMVTVCALIIYKSTRITGASARH
jgi:Bacterial membrane protein YfhO